VEVAGSPQDYDRQTKLPRYAAAGIVEVWIVDVAGGLVKVYREPAGSEYTVRSVHGRGDSLSPKALPDVAITVDEIVG
jgi:Uma2 family endonuclease